MENINTKNVEIASPSVVKEAAHNFARALTETAQFKAFEQAAALFQQDGQAQKAMQAFQQKQNSLRAMIMLNALSTKDREELETLRNNFVNQPVVKAYVEAQTELAVVCQAAGNVLSEELGVNYSAACGASCCG